MRRALLAALLVVAAPLSAACNDEPEEGGPVVETASGRLEGEQTEDVRSWRGVPYAAPPVGDLRWRPPQPAEPWSGVRSATSYGPACLQGPATALGDALFDVDGTDEDCLTLNVHRPANDDERLPVIVWLHGGAFSYGSGRQAVFNSPELVERGVVLVTLNYRLGRLGFLAHPALVEDGERIANFGLLDQVAALQWVQDNIAAFGGDPDNVTVFGESAGGTSVNALMSAPVADGLFDKAISQSGLGREETQSWDDASREAVAVTTELLGPDVTAEDLRAMPAADVMADPVDILQGEAPISDSVLPQPVDDSFEAGLEADVPYLVGTTDLEVPDIFFERLGTDPDQLRDDFLGARKAEVLAAYGDERELDLHLVSDVIFTEPARFLADRHADDAPTYRYRFAIAPDTVLDELGGAPHASELPFVFDDTARQGTPVDDADSLADAIADLWVDFATDAEPDGWPLADSGGLMSFTLDGPVVGPDPWAARLDAVEDGYGEQESGRSTP